MNSGAGKITNIIYNYLEPDCRVDIMPALGTHFPHDTRGTDGFLRGPAYRKKGS